MNEEEMLKAAAEIGRTLTRTLDDVGKGMQTAFAQVAQAAVYAGDAMEALTMSRITLNCWKTNEPCQVDLVQPDNTLDNCCYATKQRAKMVFQGYESLGMHETSNSGLPNTIDRWTGSMSFNPAGLFLGGLVGFIQIDRTGFIKKRDRRGFARGQIKRVVWAKPIVRKVLQAVSRQRGELKLGTTSLGEMVDITVEPPTYLDMQRLLHAMSFDQQIEDQVTAWILSVDGGEPLVNAVRKMARQQNVRAAAEEFEKIYG